MAQLRPAIGQAINQRRRPRQNVPAQALSRRVDRPAEASLRERIRKTRGNVLIGLKAASAPRVWESGRLAAVTLAEMDEGYRLLDSLGINVTSSFEFRPIVTATLRPGQLEGLLASPFVDYVEPDFDIAPQSRAAKALGGSSATTQNWPQDSTWAIHRVGAPSAWTQNQGQWASVTILDSGLDLIHMTSGDGPASLASCAYVPIVADEPGCTSGPSSSHGAMVAGLIASSDNAFGGIGVSPSLWQFNSVRVCRRTASDNRCPIGAVAWGLQWATDRNLPRHIVNISLGYCIEDISLQAAIQDAVQSGILVVAAAGNRYLDDPDCDGMENALPSYSAVKFPAAFDGVLAVGGSMYLDNGVPPLLNRVVLPPPGGGDSDHACDPVQDVDDCESVIPPYQTPEEQGFPGFPAFELTDSSCAGYGSRHGPEVALVAPFWSKSMVTDGEYGGSCGTSFSAPIVAGVAALIWSRHTSYTAAQVRSHLLATAIPLTGGRKLVYAGLELPALSIGMGGPQEIDSEGTYTWTASPPTHWPNPISFTWHYSESSSGPWEWGGSGPSHFRYVSASSPAGFWIRLTATSGSSQATSLRYVTNSAVNPCYPYDCE